MPHRPRLAVLSSLFVVALLCASMAFAQSGSGSLSGHITDASGAALPGVTITATNEATGFNRTVVTDSDGSYKFPTLPIGKYTVLTDLSGFAAVATKNVEVNVASERALNVSLKPASVKEQITVTAEAPLVATGPSAGTVVSQRELENLPLNGRQFANLGSLAPGTSLSVNSDPTKPGQLTIALNGGSGRNVNFLVDGGDNTDDTIGGALQNYNIEAVQEFKIQTQQYKAEFGRTTGGVLSVVTKTGTNDFEGSAYEFYRDKSLNEETTSEKAGGSGKTPYRRDQYGASFGGPIIKDRAHFFATVERTDRKTNYVLASGGIFPNLDGQAVATPFKDDLLTAKASADINAKQFLQVRYGYQKNSDKYGASPIIMPSALGTITNNYHSILAGHTWQVGANSVNEFLFQNTHFKNFISPDSEDPAVIYPSGVSIGQSINTPQSTTQIKRQFKDDFSWSQTLGSMRNDFKVGANFIDEPLLGGDFSVGTTGQYTLTQDKQGSPIADITIFGGKSIDSTPVKQYNYYVQDDISVNKNLTFNVGLRYDLWKGFDLDQRSNVIWQTLSTQTKYNEYYLKAFQGGKGGKLSNDNNNWGPRLGFTYDLTGDSKKLIRGGYGRYFDFPYTNATILFPASAVQSNYGVIYNNHDDSGIKNANGSLYQIGQPLPPNQLPGADIPPPNEIANPNLATPYSDQFSLGYSWQVSPSLGLTIDGSHIDYKDIPYRFRANPIDPATGKRRFAAFGSFRMWMGDGSAKYNGLNIGGHARIGDKFELQGFYTLSHATGNVLAGADEFRITAAEHQPDLRTVRDQSVDPYNPTCSACFGPLDTDSRHRVTVSALYRAPFGINLSGIGRYRSATPYTDWAGKDLNGDGYAFDLAPGVSHVNTLRGASFSQVDVRVGKEFTFLGNRGIELIAEVFNVFNSKNEGGFVGNRASGAYRAPSFFAGDPGQGEQRLVQLGTRIRF
ncbi:MAG TPA: TonB-dependent receptor [Thermoanaerobaculia bacterium]|nr:TonB-dependent receptor [Thermoanaerobaculia bacterium]